MSMEQKAKTRRVGARASRLSLHCDRTMAASIPFVTIESTVAALSKIDVLHELMGSNGVPLQSGSESFLLPLAIHAVAEGDHELWDGSTVFTNSDALRFRVGDRVQCLHADVWLDGIIIRQPVMDGQQEAYDVKLADGQRVLFDKDDLAVIRAGEPRRVHHYELVFGAIDVSDTHDEALGRMGAFGRDVQLASSAGPPEICGRCVRQLTASAREEVRAALRACLSDGATPCQHPSAASCSLACRFRTCPALAADRCPVPRDHARGGRPIGCASASELARAATGVGAATADARPAGGHRRPQRPRLPRRAGRR